MVSISTANISAEKRRLGILNAPIHSQLFKLTLPMTFGIFAIMFLFIVDSYFIGALGSEQLAAIGFIMPIVFMASGISAGMGMGISSLASRIIGSKSQSEAARIITSGYYAIIIISCVLSFLLHMFLEPVFRLMGAESNTFHFISQYMSLWVFSAPLLMIILVTSSVFRSIGDTKSSAVLNVSTATLNMLLDPLFIFGLGPIPAMGIKGAALAHMIAVIIGLTFGLYRLAFKEKVILLSLPKLESMKEDWAQLSTIATPAILANLIVPVTATILTAIVATHGYEAVAAFGVGNRIADISLIVMFALSATLPMFIGQNLGAQQPQRVKQSLNIVFKFIIIWQLFIAFILFITAKYLAVQFSDDHNIQNFIVDYLTIIPISYGLFGIIILVNVSINVLGKPRIALLINSIRLICIYIPLTYLGSYIDEPKDIFILMCAANCTISLLSYYLLRRVLKDQKII